MEGWTMIFRSMLIVFAALSAVGGYSADVVSSSSSSVGYVSAPPIKCGGPVDAFTVILGLGGLDVRDRTLRNRGILKFRKDIGPFKEAVVTEFASGFRPLTRSLVWGGKAESVVSTALVERVAFDVGVKQINKVKEMIVEAMWVNDEVVFSELKVSNQTYVLKTARPGLAGWTVELRLDAYTGYVKYCLELRRSIPSSRRTVRPVDVDI